MDKLTLAHDWAMKYGEKSLPQETAWRAWEYADAMFEEFEKRKDKNLPDALWQPDWSLAPDDAVACAMDLDLSMWWHTDKPTRRTISWLSGSSAIEYTNHNYTGDWRNSLRIRPQGK